MITAAPTGRSLAAELVSLSEGLVSLSQALARALETGDLDAAERLVEERGRVLDRVLSPAHGRQEDTRSELAEVARAVSEADTRSRSALLRGVARLREELSGLASGVAALRVYGSPERLAPGFVDRRD